MATIDEKQQLDSDSPLCPHAEKSELGPFGMNGLLAFLQHLQEDQSIGTLALGLDLTGLGINLNSQTRTLYQTFGGPWKEHACRSQEVEVPVPEEYTTNNSIRDKLPNIKVENLHDEVLFFLFYNCPGEIYQIDAAAELYRRDWRFHKINEVWLTRFFSGKPRGYTGSHEKSTFNVFDPKQFKTITKDMVLEYKYLEERPFSGECRENDDSIAEKDG